MYKLICTLLSTWGGPFEDLQSFLSDLNSAVLWDILSWKLYQSLSPQTLSSMFSHRGEMLGSVCAPLGSPPQPGHAPGGQPTSFLVSCLSFITCCPMTWKPSFYIFCSDFSSCFQWNGKSGSCYSILARSRPSRRSLMSLSCVSFPP